MQSWTGTAGYWFAGYWDIEPGLQGIGLQIWDCRVLDYKSGIVGYWITSGIAGHWITGLELRVLDNKFGILGYGVTNLEFQGIGLQGWNCRVLDYRSGISVVLDYKSGIPRYWVTYLGLKGIGLENWNCRVLDYRIGISGYWITNLEFQDIGLQVPRVLPQPQ